MVAASPPPRRRPGRGWYAVGIVLAVLGIIGAIVLGGVAVSVARDAKVTTLPDDGTITLTEHRFAVWVRADLPDDARGADLGVRCTVTPQGGPPIEVPALRNQSAYAGGWHLVALSARDSTTDWAGNPATLSCAADDPALLDAAWGTGKQPQLLAVIVLALAALAVGVGGVLLGALAALIVLLLRRRVRTA